MTLIGAVAAGMWSASRNECSLLPTCAAPRLDQAIQEASTT